MDFVKEHWESIGVIFVLFRIFIIGVRDALDKTPDTDDNLFERIVTIIKKAGAYAIFGTRAK